MNAPAPVRPYRVIEVVDCPFRAPQDAGFDPSRTTRRGLPRTSQAGGYWGAGALSVGAIDPRRNPAVCRQVVYIMRGALQRLLPAGIAIRYDENLRAAHWSDPHTNVTRRRMAIHH
jgi:hypothetical protein